MLPALRPAEIGLRDAESRNAKDKLALNRSSSQASGAIRLTRLTLLFSSTFHTYFSARRSAWGCGVDLFVRSKADGEADSDLSFWARSSLCHGRCFAYLLLICSSRSPKHRLCSSFEIYGTGQLARHFGIEEEPFWILLDTDAPSTRLAFHRAITTNMELHK
jgi:hypothetical protein